MGEPLIALVQDAQTELGLPLSQQVILANDNTGRQFGGLANRIGRMMLRMHDWTFLTREFHITIQAPVTYTGTLTQGNPVIPLTAPSGSVGMLTPSQMVVTGMGIMTSVRLIATDPLNNTVTIDQPPTMSGTTPLTFRQDFAPQPTDYERSINRTQWDRSMRWELRGPQSPQSDQWVRSGIVATGPRRQYREINNGFRFWPAPSATDAGSQLISEYVSTNWVFDAGGNPKPRFTADQDSCVFEDDMMITGLKMLFFQIKGFDFSTLKDMWMQAVHHAIAVDGPSPTLDLDRSRFPIFISPSNVQDSDFPGSFGNR